MFVLRELFNNLDKVLEENKKQNVFNIIGVMSGSSLDGLDIAHCVIEKQSNGYKYSIKKAKTYAYKENEMLKQLKSCKNLSAYDFCVFDRQYGEFIGGKILEFFEEFLSESEVNQIDFVASHGHTIFHTPNQNKVTVQIGHIPSITAICKKNVIGDFRSMDTALGGQGAPLVPIGDSLLFSTFDFCLNMGGISNVSFKNKNNQRIAYDIGPCNIILNYLAEQMGLQYDEDGKLAQKGEIDEQLLKQLKNNDFFKQKLPKSLDREQIEDEFIPFIEMFDSSIEDKICTCSELIAWSISQAIIQGLYGLKDFKDKDKEYKILVTGGGAFNKYIINRINEQIKKYKTVCIVPEKNLVEFKEALIFAFLGFLTWNQKYNCLKSITGAKQNSIGGLTQYYNEKA